MECFIRLSDDPARNRKLNLYRTIQIISNPLIYTYLSEEWYTRLLAELRSDPLGMRGIKGRIIPCSFLPLVLLAHEHVQNGTCTRARDGAVC